MTSILTAAQIDALPTAEFTGTDVAANTLLAEIDADLDTDTAGHFGGGLLGLLVGMFFAGRFDEGRVSAAKALLKGAGYVAPEGVTAADVIAAMNIQSELREGDARYAKRACYAAAVAAEAGLGWAVATIVDGPDGAGIGWAICLDELAGLPAR